MVLQTNQETTGLSMGKVRQWFHAATLTEEETC